MVCFPGFCRAELSIRSLEIRLGDIKTYEVRTLFLDQFDEGTCVSQRLGRTLRIETRDLHWFGAALGYGISVRQFGAGVWGSIGICQLRKGLRPSYRHLPRRRAGLAFSAPE
jgi:site-specific recombinase